MLCLVFHVAKLLELDRIRLLENEVPGAAAP
jgi:hypothetical protein